MPASTWNLEFLNHNSQRAYPLAEHVSAADRTGSIRIPRDLIVELYLPISTALDTLPDKFFIRSLTIVGGGITVEIGYDDGTADPPVIASTTASTSGFRENSRFALVGVNDFDDTVGTIVFGRLAGVDALPPGEYLFDPEDTLLDPDAIRPMIRGVSSLSVEQGGQRGPQLRDDIVIEAGANIRLSTVFVPNDWPRIRIDAIPDTTLTRCDCAEQLPPCIRTINDIPPDARRNFNLLGDNCLTLTPITHGLSLRDTCCQPCCGARELDEVFRLVRGLESSAQTVGAQASTLSARITQFEAVVLASRIGSGCEGSGGSSVP
ncbi:MAG: hypothetical protein E6Q97_26660 [Desulfurellales bacterium]|nr:MAG: hypothetical protein E6Q97_26660 [Desulfurellales bacterium]